MDDGEFYEMLKFRSPTGFLVDFTISIFVTQAINS